MKITILNGNSKKENVEFDKYTESVKSFLEEKGNTVVAFKLRDMNIRDCLGCFGCWAITPGLCLQKDDYSKVLREIVNSDFVIFASPIVMLFMTALLKRAVDRLMPLSCAFFELKPNKRISHVRRYEKYPRIGVILEKEKDVNNADIETIRNVFVNIVVGGKNLRFMRFTSDSMKDIYNEINNI